jgi:hypothetical protein
VEAAAPWLAPMVENFRGGTIPVAAPEAIPGAETGSFAGGPSRIATDADRNAIGSMNDLPLDYEGASKSASLYDPSAKPPRPFEADYPEGVSGEPGSPLSVDNGGTALTARNIVGRRVLGGADEALAPERLKSGAASVIGSPPVGVAGRAIGGDAGRFHISHDAEGEPDYKIFVDKGLPANSRDKVVTHEFGHVIDYFSRDIPTDGLLNELRPLYNTLNTGTERTRNLMGPQHLGYKGEEIGREYMAEAIRAYMADPNYIKTVAPKTAARIREYVNTNPRLNKIIQFNGIAGALPIGGAAAGVGSLAPQDQRQ